MYLKDNDGKLEYLDPLPKRRVKPPMTLLPCPCCGSQPELWEDPQAFAQPDGEDCFIGAMGYFIRCKGCLIQTGTFRDAYPGIKSITSQWNRRDWSPPQL